MLKPLHRSFAIVPAAKSVVFCFARLQTFAPAIGKSSFGGFHRCMMSASPAKKARASMDGKDAAAAGNQLVWLRQDLRLHDHPALCAAAAAAKSSNSNLRLVFIFSPEEDGDDLKQGTSWRPVGASLAWLQASLTSLDLDLQRKFGPGAAIIFRKGPYLESLQDLAAQCDAKCLHYSRRYEPAMRSTDERVHAALEESGLQVVGHQGHLLHEPEGAKIDMNHWKGHFGTLMPFLIACERLEKPARPLPAPTSLPVPAEAIDQGGLNLEELEILKLPRRIDGSVVDWAGPMLESWDCSESAALDLLENFVTTGLQNYESQRGKADARSVSKVSPYLRWGQLSPRYMHQRVAQAGGKQVSKTFWRRLTWRDLSYWQLHHWPTMVRDPIRSHYADQKWREDEQALRAWQKGQTGFPLVDAGMRQLYQTGWMQQNVRMVVAAFLTEYLSIHWIHGCRWFHDTLVDADLAINSMMWQNAGKAGLDQWNFTVLPTSSSQDSGGQYVSQWVPEVRQLPKKYMHKPWEAPAEDLQAAGITLGQTYPHRIEIEKLEVLRHQNEEWIRGVRQAHPEWSDRGGYDLILVPQGSTVSHDGQKMRVFTKPIFRDWNSDHPVKPISTGRGGGRGRRRGRGRGRGRGQGRGHSSGSGRGRSGSHSHQTTLPF
ncbi:hypothetical protein WJX74_000355 [Apatococcus lobatus]|uniref:Photolyase/cryptochrome alpha/beta domain-containing protein n=1 Tax=Apatococcus lobatus TaxID=904363 RepID=A0AAW1RD92_9CHLO